jgi:hypothetical protein
VVGFCEHGNEPSGSGATERVVSQSALNSRGHTVVRDGTRSHDHE